MRLERAVHVRILFDLSVFASTYLRGTWGRQPQTTGGSGVREELHWSLSLSSPGIVSSDSSEQHSASTRAASTPQV